MSREIGTMFATKSEETVQGCNISIRFDYISSLIQSILHVYSTHKPLYAYPGVNMRDGSMEPLVNGNVMILIPFII